MEPRTREPLRFTGGGLVGEGTSRLNARLERAPCTNGTGISVSV